MVDNSDGERGTVGEGSQGVRLREKLEKQRTNFVDICEPTFGKLLLRWRTFHFGCMSVLPPALLYLEAQSACMEHFSGVIHHAGTAQR